MSQLRNSNVHYNNVLISGLGKCPIFTFSLLLFTTLCLKMFGLGAQMWIVIISSLLPTLAAVRSLELASVVCLLWLLSRVCPALLQLRKDSVVSRKRQLFTDEVML